MTDDAMIAYIVREFEGEKFTADPIDAGGATKWGITFRTLSVFFNRPVQLGEVAALTFERACDVHRYFFLTENRLAAVRDWRLKLVTLDAAINFGNDDAIPWLQHAVEVEPADGRIGPATLAACERADGLTAAVRVVVMRQRRHLDQVRARSTQARFLSGWLRRCTALLDIITRPTSPPVTVPARA